jgi:hypothetical protein
MIAVPEVANDGDGRDPDATDPGDALLQGQDVGFFAGCPTGFSSWHGTGVAGIHGVTRAIVAAAGNDSQDVANETPTNCLGYYAVASTSTTAGDLAAYSNSASSIDISAPGGTLKFRVEGGTGLAAPMMSGTVSLMLAVAPWLTADRLHSILTSTAKPFAAFAYTVNGVSQTKPITRQVFTAPGTVCK